MDENIYQHFRKEERPFIDKVRGWMEQAAGEYRPYLTDFLDPRQIFIVESLIGEQGDLHHHFFGGYNAAERQRAIIAPSYFQPTQDDFELQLFEIHYPEKFAQLSHSKVLGTLVNAGIVREAFGDIMSDGTRWQFFVTAKMADYVQTQISQMGRINVRLDEEDYTHLLTPIDDWTEEATTISSLRLDAVVASVYNLSRQRAKEMIQGEKIKLNWQVYTKPDFEINLQDIVSVRGFGRIQLRRIEGRTRKDKIKVTLGVLRK